MRLGILGSVMWAEICDKSEREGLSYMSGKKDTNNGFALSDEKMDFLIKEAVRLELEKRKIQGLKSQKTDATMVNAYAKKA